MSNSAKIIETFINALWLEFGLSDNTLFAYSSDLRQFDAWLKSKTLLETSAEDISKFLQFRQQQGTSSRSAARILSSLRRLYGFLLRESKIIRLYLVLWPDLLHHRMRQKEPFLEKD